ncbi:pyridoxamine 5'-phosphate oxidase family protein [Acuticoccus sp.]|uniref:pyridoxamine 5'-phosphate oxidase family protein n=1 Tax=Acuticoccus sp. TaxID=1904378 RepID=UPI003B51DC5B
MHDLMAVEDAAWAMLAEGAASRHAAFHQMAVATVNADGRPEARTVVLRGADRAARTVRFHTDLRAGKVGDLADRPELAAVLYDHDAKVQVRLSGGATLHHRDDLAASTWAGMRDFSKACYRQASAPGRTLADHPAMIDTAAPLPELDGFGNFVAVTLRVATLEWLYLAARGHRRALVSYGAAEGRTWLAP